MTIFGTQIVRQTGYSFLPKRGEGRKYIVLAKTVFNHFFAVPKYPKEKKMFLLQMVKNKVNAAKKKRYQIGL